MSERLTRREQNILARLYQIRDLVRSGITEHVGKTYRGADGKIAGRHKGGFGKQFPEIARAGLTPGQAADAIDRGRGPRFKRLIAAIAQHEFPERKQRGPGKPQVPPHAGTRACSACGVDHSKDKHRFHGEGAYYRTHATARELAEERAAMRENPKLSKTARWILDHPTPHGTVKAPNMRKASRDAMRELVRNGYVVLEQRSGRYGYWPVKRKNPSRKKSIPLVVIYGRVLSIAAQKTQKHVCDEECKDFKHSYQHDFRKGSASMYGLPEGSVLVLPNGTQIRLHSRSLLIASKL